jgi:hypothetical protein
MSLIVKVIFTVEEHESAKFDMWVMLSREKA